MKYVLTIIALWFTMSLTGQTDSLIQFKIDSLYTIVKSIDDHRAKIETLSEITSNAIRYPYLEVFRAIDLMSELAEDSIQTYLVYNQNNVLGQVFRHLGNDTLALKYYERNNELAKSYHLMPEYLNISLVYANIGDREKSLSFRKKARNISVNFGPNNLAYALYFYGTGIHNEKQDSGRIYIDSAIAIWESLPLGDYTTIYFSNTREPGALTQAWSYLAARKLGEGNLDEVGDLLNKVRFWAEEEECTLGRYFSIMSNYYFRLPQLDSALHYARAMLKFYSKPSCFGEIKNRSIAAAHFKIYAAYNQLGESDSALHHYRLYSVMDNQINDEIFSRTIDLRNHQREKAEQRQNHEDQINQATYTRNIIAFAGLMFLLLAGAFYSRWRYVRKSRASIEKEKERSENLLLNILPEEIANELKEKGKAEARDFDLVSILFTDFKGFTEHSASLSAAELVNEINHCFEAFDHIIDKYGIEKIKTIGDAYMAAGGLPVPSTDSVKNTVLAALEMQDFIESRRKIKDERGEAAFAMRVGIHTGPVVAGIVGVKKFQYDIWGDTVNTASRIESNGEIGKVNISLTTYKLIKEDPQFTFEDRGKIEVKGKGEIEMFFVANSEIPDDHAKA